jgi:site-specific DNA-cytosine methylase
VWENVVGCLTSNNGEDWETIQKLFTEANYEIDYEIYNARQFAPTIQQRKRVILLATHKQYKKARLNRTIPDIELSREMQNIQKRLVSISKSHRKEHVDVRLNHGIANTLTTGVGCAGMSTTNYIVEDGIIRDLSVTECELLMTWPKNLTKYGSDGVEIPIRQRYKICGNGVVSSIIPHALNNIFD